MISFSRVSRHTPCPVCGKPDWCAYNSKYVICMRRESPHISGNGGWVHESAVDTPIIVPLDAGSIPRRSDRELDQAYRQLLSSLPLNARHAAQLKGRGMSDSEITRGMYRTLPDGPGTSCLGPASGIPGFGLDKKGRWVFTGKAGLAIPVISSEGLIVSILIRPDKQEQGKKYKLLSSSWLDQGASPGTRIHVAVPETVHDQRTAWIVEGPLKGNIVAERTGAVTYATPGVSSWGELKNMILPKTVIIAFDNDYCNYHVRYHARALSNYLIKAGKDVYAALWENHKGPDDALVGEEKIKLYKLFWRILPKRLV